MIQDVQTDSQRIPENDKVLHIKKVSPRTERISSSMTKELISLGLIGYSGQADDLLLEQIRSMPRLRVHALHACRFACGSEAARRARAVPMGSLRQILENNDIDGVILAGTQGIGDFGCWYLAASQKPVLIRAQVLKDRQFLNKLEAAQLLENPSGMMLPELLHRWFPSTLRLRELIATTLGPAREVRAQCAGMQDHSYALMTVINFCRMLISTVQTSVRRVDSDHVEMTMLLTTGKEIRLHLAFAEPTDQGTCKLAIECERGRARIYSAEKIDWETNGTAESESLEHERSAEHVLLDLFGRRIAGGIIPVPTVGYSLSAYRLADAALHSLETGDALVLSEKSLTVNDCEFRR